MITIEDILWKFLLFCWGSSVFYFTMYRAWMIKYTKILFLSFSCDVHLSTHPFPLFLASALDGCEQSFLCFDRCSLRENSCGIHEAEDRRVPGPAFMCWWSGNTSPSRKSNSFRPDLCESLAVLNRIQSGRIDSDIARYCESRYTFFFVQNIFLVFIILHAPSQVVSLSSRVVPSRFQSIRVVPSLESYQVESSQVKSIRLQYIR